ncbi:hypothetical protein CPIN18021_0291 [Campylobacter pinnipediorum subsp. caledonicus]|uniref:DUF4376 domain-containing protein n=1 Tax=Campylobacter pinnipediorum subsp. caledonicus TaxID=1874362 RepID=A0A1S6U5U1_9BACT|nr:hypothetical protein [Campylobacter pinnipediorum]AQW85553.1 hypothetical protein CPIN18020_0312 [Campylobacter pinnipediorum subsp. caledonicus]AQW87138.1 hypothetical protein CPIN18021_0291 [Campylobacter pinnipediorum subsp. caledonicus]
MKKYFDKKEKRFVFDSYVTTDDGIFYLDRLSKEELNKIGLLPVVEVQINPDYQTVEYKEVDGEYVAQIIETKSIQEYTKEKLIQEFKDRAGEYLDKKAQEHGYDNILSASSYAGYENDFQEEGKAFGVWKSKVWKTGYMFLAEKGDQDPSTINLDELLEGLPELEI